VVREAATAARHGVIYFGSTSVAMQEALDDMAARGMAIDAMRVRSYPFHDSVIDFIARHDRTYIVEQNRDGQLRTLLLDTGRVDPARIDLISHYDGTPITAGFILNALAERLSAEKPHLKVVAS
jgi:2-oxoglutarate ferredoxin oxidoreductase subunit alpha